MNSIPLQLQTEFEAFLRNRSIPTGLHPFYRKWLRFYLDFCRKYRFPETERKSLYYFLLNCREKSKMMYNNSRLLMQLRFIMNQNHHDLHAYG